MVPREKLSNFINLVKIYLDRIFTCTPQMLIHQPVHGNQSKIFLILALKHRALWYQLINVATPQIGIRLRDSGVHCC